mmetsp:Transcript_33691/g.81466  ORF Transcript_33691/g.81466 Transcript_33691/m.81466 type:complete len:211 (-) Transcript_33691:915-1547(-)
MVRLASANCCAMTSCCTGSFSLSIISCATAFRLSSLAANWGNMVIRALYCMLSDRESEFTEPEDRLVRESDLPMDMEIVDMEPRGLQLDMLDAVDMFLAAFLTPPPVRTSIEAPDISPISSGVWGTQSSLMCSCCCTCSASESLFPWDDSPSSPSSLSKSKPMEASPSKNTICSESRISSTTSLASAANMSPLCFKLFSLFWSPSPPEIS